MEQRSCSRSCSTFCRELLDAQLGDEELHPGLGPTVPRHLAVPHPQHGLAGDDEVLRGGDRLERLGLVRVGAQAAADVQPEALHPVHLDGHDADVVDAGQGAVHRAARGRDLELAGQVLHQRVAQEVPGHGLGGGLDVEHLQRAGAGEVAGGDGADRVAAGLAGGDARLGQAPQRLGRVADVDEVELHVLPGGEVPPAAAVLLGDVGHRVQRVRGQGTADALGPDHVHVGEVPLAVDAVPEPDPAPVLGVELAGEVARQVGLVAVQVAVVGERRGGLEPGEGGVVERARQGPVGVEVGGTAEGGDVAGGGQRGGVEQGHGVTSLRCGRRSSGRGWGWSRGAGVTGGARTRSCRCRSSARRGGPRRARRAGCTGRSRSRRSPPRPGG